jgi:hypothetical protein
MSEDKNATRIGCLIIVGLFLAVGFGLPLAFTTLDSGNFSTRVIAWVFVVIMILIGMVAIPDLMILWVGGLVIAILVAWLFGDSSGACVPKMPGSCE